MSEGVQFVTVKYRTADRCCTVPSLLSSGKGTLIPVRKGKFFLKLMTAVNPESLCDLSGLIAGAQIPQYPGISDTF